jgi:hypothetical protein
MTRYKPPGTYFARVRIRGMLFRQTLNTSVMSVAKLRLGDFVIVISTAARFVYG